MSEEPLRLRLKTKNGQHLLNELTMASTLGELKALAASVSGIAAHHLRLLQGYPPKELDISGDGLAVSALNLRSGDALIVEQDPQVTAAMQQQASKRLLEGLQSQVGQGMLVREVVPADNSCLFTSIDYVMNNGVLNLKSADPMRQLIASVVASNPATYNEAFLGKPNADYCTWILHSGSWGGAIEISILSQYYKVEIAVVDTQTVRIDRFGENNCYPQRVMLLYDGIHYDPLHMEMLDTGALVTKFSSRDAVTLSKALELASEAKSSRQFTDTANFTLRCLICNKALTGGPEAQAHAQQTGHQNFGEV